MIGELAAARKARRLAERVEARKARRLARITGRIRLAILLPAMIAGLWLIWYAGYLAGELH